MSRLEERQQDMRARFASDLSRRIHQPWEDYSASQPKLCCESCNTPFIAIYSKICGQCQARKKEFAGMIQLLEGQVGKGR